MILRHILAVENDGPICGPCVAALGGTAIPDRLAAAEYRRCGHCGEIRVCTRVDNHSWPPHLIRPDPAVAAATRRKALEGVRTAAADPGLHGRSATENASHGPAGARPEASGEEGAQ